MTEQAKVEPKVEGKTARSENSSISVASTAAPAKTPVAAATKETSAKPVDCKKFFPSVGLTLSVPCE